MKSRVSDSASLLQQHRIIPSLGLSRVNSSLSPAMKFLPFFLFGLGLLLADDSLLTLQSYNPCRCETVTWGKDEMQGHLKLQMRHHCDGSFECSFIIEPKDNHIVYLNPSYRSGITSINVFYYNGSTKNEDVIFHNDLGKNSEAVYSPEGFGLFINISSSGLFMFGSNIDIEFNRILANSTTERCPPPYLTATSTPTKFNFTNFPKSGCAFRMTADHAINFQAACDYDRRMTISANYAGSLENIEEVTQRLSNYNDKRDFKINGAADVQLKKDIAEYYYRDFEMCDVSYFAIDYNPCNCTQTQFNLTLDKTMTLSSPGYPSLLCRNLECHYNFSVNEKPKNGAKTAFVVNAVHNSRAFGDKLEFIADGKSKMKLNERSKNMTDVAIYTGKTFEVDYHASSVLSNSHGFAMEITAIHIPEECICSTDAIKELTGMKGTYNMKISAYCPVMHCRFSVINDQPKKSRMFRMKLDYHLPHDGEILEMDGGEEVVYRQQGYEMSAGNNAIGSDIIDLVTNTSVTLNYIREKSQTVSLAHGDSNFTLNWEWLTNTDCEKNCNMTLLASNEWLAMYSPRHPMEYCSNQNCHYRIQAPKGYLVQLNVTEFETEPHSDFLYIYDGSEDGKQLAKLNGVKQPKELFQSTGKDLALYFTSDDNHAAKGFTVLYRAIPAPKTPVHVPIIVLAMMIALLVLGGVGFLTYKKCPFFRNFLQRFGKNSTAPAVINPVYGFSVVDEILIEKIDSQ